MRENYEGEIEIDGDRNTRENYEREIEIDGERERES